MANERFKVGDDHGLVTEEAVARLAFLEERLAGSERALHRPARKPPELREGK